MNLVIFLSFFSVAIVVYKVQKRRGPENLYVVVKDPETGEYVKISKEKFK